MSTWMLVLGLVVTPQGGGQAAPPDPKQRALEIYQPSSPHRALGRLAGTWDQEIDFASGDKTIRLSGRVENRMMLGGRFLVSEGRAQGALEYESTLIFGFDGRSREHTAVVFDSFGTYYVEARAPHAGDRNEIRMNGETSEGKGRKRFEVVLTWVDADTYRVQIIFLLEGRPPVVAVSSVHRRVTGSLAPEAIPARR